MQMGCQTGGNKRFFDNRTSALPEIDSDGDGQKNLAEFLGGTHPLDGGFQAQQWAPFLRNLVVNDEFASVEVVGFEGATHRIEVSTDLQEWHPACTNVFSGQAVVIPRISPSGANAFFYRAAVEER